MKITNEILKRIIKEEMDSTLKELVSGPGDFNNEPEISQAKWLALGDLLGLGRAGEEEAEQAEKEAIENYFKNQNQRNWKAVSLDLDNQFGQETANQIRDILAKKDTMQ